MSVKIKPVGARVLVEVLEDKDKYVKTESGILLEKEEERKTHVTIRAKILEVGSECEIFTDKQVGLVVILHEYGGTKIKSITGKELRIINELDAHGYEY